MSFVLGIDTGGTYTDGIILDRKERKIVSKAKSLTTRENLSLGISDVIRQLEFDPAIPIEFVALSTTLATNAIVEGRGCEVGLILIGFSEHKDVPAKEICYINGGHDIRGRAKCPLDKIALKEALEQMRGKVDALAISSFLSVRNPEHELAALKISREILNLPVVCGHHLTRSLGVHERTVTALLNARLIPIIDELMESVKLSLSEKGITVPIMIVKGDGSLMGELQARERPIETILSGPAASIIGANFLADEKDALVLDMGGTTTDIAVLKDGIPKIDREGARVGGWLTRVEAAKIDTYGLGGDSHIQKDEFGNFKIGPRRVWPLCLMCHKYPHLIEELSEVNLPRSSPLLFSQITDCYILLNRNNAVQMNEDERKLVSLLSDGPHNLFTLARELGAEVNMLDPRRLVSIGVLGQISFTPSDILHAKGLYMTWSTEGADIGAGLISRRFDMKKEQFLDFAMWKVAERLAYTVWQSLFNHHGYNFDLEHEKLFSCLSEMQLFPKDGALLTSNITPTLPVIGIGAPVRAWLPLMAEKLGARLVIPEHTEVANAVGAAVGKVMEIVRILISPGENYTGYILYSTWERKYFEDLGEAVAYGKKYACDKSMSLAKDNGAVNVDVILDHKDVYASSSGYEKDIYVESRIEAIGTERSDWQAEGE